MCHAKSTGKQGLRNGTALATREGNAVPHAAPRLYATTGRTLGSGAEAVGRLPHTAKGRSALNAGKPGTRCRAHLYREQGLCVLLYRGPWKLRLRACDVPLRRKGLSCNVVHPTCDAVLASVSRIESTAAERLMCSLNLDNVGGMGQGRKSPSLVQRWKESAGRAGGGSRFHYLKSKPINDGRFPSPSKEPSDPYSGFFRYKYEPEIDSIVVRVHPRGCPFGRPRFLWNPCGLSSVPTNPTVCGTLHRSTASNAVPGRYRVVMGKDGSRRPWIDARWEPLSRRRHVAYPYPCSAGGYPRNPVGGKTMRVKGPTRGSHGRRRRATRVRQRSGRFRSVR